MIISSDTSRTIQKWATHWRRNCRRPWNARQLGHHKGHGVAGVVPQAHRSRMVASDHKHDVCRSRRNVAVAGDTIVAVVETVVTNASGVTVGNAGIIGVLLLQEMLILRLVCLLARAMRLRLWLTLTMAMLWLTGQVFGPSIVLAPLSIILLLLMLFQLLRLPQPPLG